MPAVVPAVVAAEVLTVVPAALVPLPMPTLSGVACGVDLSGVATVKRFVTTTSDSVPVSGSPSSVVNRDVEVDDVIVVVVVVVVVCPCSDIGDTRVDNGAGIGDGGIGVPPNAVPVPVPEPP